LGEHYVVGREIEVGDALPVKTSDTLEQLQKEFPNILLVGKIAFVGA
jgi:hypothetical protein